MARSSSIYDHFIIWSSSVTLTINLHEQMFQMALLLLKENNCAKLFWNPCINILPCINVSLSCPNIYVITIGYGSDKLNLWPFYHLTFKCNPDLQFTCTNVSNGTSTPEGEKLCKIILKSMHKCTSYGSDKLNLWPFYHLTFKCDFDLQLISTNVSNGTSTRQGKQLCQIISKCINGQVMAPTNMTDAHMQNPQQLCPAHSKQARQKWLALAEKFYPVRADPFLEGPHTLGRKQEVTEHVSLRKNGRKTWRFTHILKLSQYLCDFNW